MALQAIVDAVDNLPEAIRSEYRAGTKEEGLEGKFVLDVTPQGGFALEDVTGLRNTVATERTRADTAEKTLKKFEGLDPDKVRKDLTDLTKLREIDPNKEADKLAEQRAQARITALEETHRTELATRDARDAKRLKALQNGAVKDFINEALDGTKLVNREALEMKLQRHLRVEQTDDDENPFKIDLVDDKGNQMIGQRGQAMTAKDFVGSLKTDEKWAYVFESDGKPGSGADGKGGTRPGNKQLTRAQFEELSPTDRNQRLKDGFTVVD